METTAEHVPAAATGFNRVVAAIEPAQFPAPTPCADYDVRALLNHVLYWSPVLEAAANGVAPPADRPPNTEVAERTANLVGADWREQLGASVEALAAAWARPEAWEGTGTFIAGEMPAAVLGAMTLVDLTVHGWDLARAIGVDYPVSPELGDALWHAAATLGAQGRAAGAFGTEVPVAEDASAFERALGVFGRDPAWTP